MRVPLDFSHVPEEHKDIDKMLHNWSLWVVPSSASLSCPMFRHYRSNHRQWHLPEYRETCDVLEAMKVEKMVCSLKPLLREAVVWFYVFPAPPYKAARAMFITERELHKNLQEARESLTNIRKTWL